MSSKQRIQRYYQQCDELLSVTGLAWWLIDLDYNPDIFWCNAAMCQAFSLDPCQEEHSIQASCPIAGDYNQNIAIKSSDKAWQVLNEYQQLLHGELPYYHNRFPYYDRHEDQLRYFHSRAKALIRDDKGRASVLLGTIEQEKVNETLYQLATVDALTGLKNRRVFDQQLNLLLNLAKREQQHIGLILCDIDHFKAYNDCLGHYAGDECLQRIAKAFQRCRTASDSDVVCRYGGEEFAFIVYGKSATDMAVLAEKIRHQVHHLNIPHPAFGHIPVTISVGYTSVIPQAELSTKSLIEMADKALYQAKFQGRNTIANGGHFAVSPLIVK